HPVPGLLERHGQVERRRRLGDTALLVGERDHLRRASRAALGGGLLRLRLLGRLALRLLAGLGPDQIVGAHPTAVGGLRSSAVSARWRHLCGYFAADTPFPARA